MCPFLGANLLWAFLSGVFVASATYYALLSFACQDITGPLKRIPEDVRWISCFIVTALAMYFFKTNISSIFSTMGVTEQMTPVVLMVLFLLPLLIRGAFLKSPSDSFVPDFLVKGFGPFAFFTFCGGYCVLEFVQLAKQSGSLMDWVPLVLVCACSGLLSWRGSKYAAGEEFIPEYMSKGVFPFLFMTAFGSYSVTQFYSQASAAPGAKIEDWIPLVLICVVSGAISYWGYAVANNKDFIPSVLTKGAGPLMFFALIGSYVVYEFVTLANQFGNGLSDWSALIALCTISGALSWYGYKLAEAGAKCKQD